MPSINKSELEITPVSNQQQQQQQQYAATLTQLMLAGSLGNASSLTGNQQTTNGGGGGYDFGMANVLKMYQIQLQSIMAANYLQSIRQNGKFF